MKPNYKQAFFIAPLIIPLCTAIYSGTFFNQGATFITSEGLAQMILIFGVPITYFFVLILGLPVYSLLKESNALSYISLFLSGSITSLIVSVIIGTEGRPSLDGLTLEIFFLFFVISVSGGIGAILFAKISNDIK